MKTRRLPYACALLLLSTGCSSYRGDGVVSEMYVHRYGVPLPADEWSESGRHGQIVATMKDGVTVSRTYESGILEGESTYTFPHRDCIQKKENYCGGVLTQEMWGSPAGLPVKQVTHHSENKRSVVLWYDNGAPQCQEEYENELLVSGEYFTPNNVQETIVTDGSGTRVYRDQCGDLGHVDEIENGQIQKRTTYHANGTPESITPHVNGVPEGQRQTFFSGGEPQSVEEWSAGTRHGQTIYYENGEVVSEVPYVRGQKHGSETRYRDDGQTVSEKISWVRNSRHGPSYVFLGDTTQTDWYYRDEQVNKQTFDAKRRQE
jgi:antitoxin component YwqK of YwqJK toxin-antitoxin module